MLKPFAGVMPAVVTPLTAEGDLNPECLERLLARMYAAGASGVYLCGHTGEGPLLPAEIRRAVAQVAVQKTRPGKQVLIHVGAMGTAEAVELARDAGQAGAHGVSSLPPMGMYSFEEVKAYYQALSDAAGVPVLVYYFPQYSTSIQTVEEILELCSIQGVAGLKYTDFDLYRLSLIHRSGPVIFNGRDEILAAGMLMGADGGIGSFYNLVPELFVRIYEAARAGNWSEARNTQDWVNDLIRAVLQFPMIAAIKHLLTVSGFPCGEPVKPRRCLRQDEERRLREEVRGAGFEPDAFLTAGSYIAKPAR
jgi:N-acetylneuraminate lyase